MKLFFLCALLFASVAFAEDASDEAVITLTDANFDETIAKHENILVEFYAPWCGHCKKLAPEYEKAAKKLALEDPPLALAKLDATEHKDAGGRFDVKGFPTLKLFRNGKPVEYTGGRTEQDIINWMKKKTGPAAKAVDVAADMDKFVEGNNVAVVGFFAESDETTKKAFLDAAAAFEDVQFVYSTSADMASHLKASVPSVVLFKKFDEGKNELSDDLSADSITKFVKVNSVPLVMDFDQAAAAKIFGGDVPALLLIFNPEEESHKAAEKELRSVAEKLKGRVLMSVAHSTDGLGKRLMGFIGIEENQTPSVRLIKPSPSLLKYLYEAAEITADKLEAFVSSFEAGTLKPFLKSEEIPADNSKPVKVLVGKNFHDIVMDESKDVLVEFYAPWCGHCKKLEPIFDKVAEKLSHVEGLVLAKMDSTANEVEGVDIKGFPTLKYYPAKDKTPVEYKGGRTEGDFIQYLQEHATVPFDLNKSTAEGSDDEKDEL
eukprot:GILJ01000739.1.p1 GENE.GILJ01000739.1~~GILJ01000739.1.p1  ORF type:complete len:489 (+),score=141.09 GILJ01000739.1:50-1516(+)